MNHAPTSLKKVTSNDFPSHALIYYFSKQVKEIPDSIAVSFGELTVSYAELNARSNQFAGYLIGRNIRVGDVIGLSIDKSIDMVICFLGTLKAGAAYLPLDPMLSVNRIEYMIVDSGHYTLNRINNRVDEFFSNRFNR